jgi:lipid-A-disaccharide synthase
MSEPRCDCYFLTGEPSGDGYAAALARRLLQRCPSLHLRGIGGSELAQAGVVLDERMDGRAVIGVFPVLRRLPEFLALGRRVEAAIRRHRPRLVVSIDYPGFNLRLQRRLADLTGSRRVHVVAPQVWAWRPRRAKTYARSVDHLLCFFPFEPPLFQRFGCQAEFLGHPMVDIVAGEDAVEREPDLLLLAPGGRRREVETLLPDFDLAARIVQRRLAQRDGCAPRVCIAAAEGVPDAIYAGLSRFPARRGDYRGLCRRARVAAIASGTATLEAALLGLPQVIAYRMDRVSHRIARHLITTRWIGLPNLVHGQTVVPELIQDACRPTALAARLLELWEEEGWQAAAKRLDQTAARLGGPGALDRIAKWLENRLA